MRRTLLHVYRNTALGRETLLQSAYFCQKTGCKLGIYIPRASQVLMYFKHSVATIGLDSSYLRAPDSAESRAAEIADEFDVTVEMLEPTGYTATDLPNLDGEFGYMACPRSMSERTTKIRFGHLGPRVRAVVRAAPFPVLLPTPVFKPWHSVVACFGGSENSLRAISRALQLSKSAQVPLSLFTHAEGQSREDYEKLLEGSEVHDKIVSGEVEWTFSDSGALAESLFDIPRDTLVVSGAYGAGVVREALFGSKLEAIQTEVPNNLLVVGPEVAAG
jgi:nucleotide-binding universal stress UspA family protein